MAASAPTLHATGPVDDDGPLRRCVATRRTLPKSALIRFVAAPDGSLTPDIAGRLPGRGVYVAAERAAVVHAAAKGLFARTLKTPVRVPEGLVERLAGQLLDRCVELIGLARRGGGTVAGFDKVRTWLAAGRAGLLLHAADGSSQGQAKLAPLVGAVPVVEGLSAAELGRAFGRDIVVHCAITPGPLAERLIVEVARLDGLRRPDNDARPGDNAPRRVDAVNGRGQRSGSAQQDL